MDEIGVRALLDRVAEDDLPPVRVDIGMAAGVGRRRLRRRRAYLALAPAAVGAAVAVIAVVPIGLGGGHGERSNRHRAAPTAGPSMPPFRPAIPATPVRTFNPMRPYAAFGWLPPHYSASGRLPYDQNLGTTNFPDGMATDVDQLVAVDTAARGTEYLMLNVGAEGNCKLAVRHVWTLSCYNGMSEMTLATPAPKVSGLPAYWDTYGNLAWEYAPNSWAQLIVRPEVPPGGTPAFAGPPAIPQSAAGEAIELRIASGVRYGPTATLPVFPFKLTGVAAGWSALRGGQSAYGMLDGRLVFTGVTLGPAADPDALSVTVQPVGETDTKCQLESGYSYVTVDGTRAVLSGTVNSGKNYQYLCAGDVRGLVVQIGLDLVVEGSDDVPVPGDFASAEAVFSHLSLLGRNPAGWTTDPLP
jgi:hypothetical protein